MDKALEEIEFVIFDTETTGLDPASGDRIVEIAAIRIKGEESLSTFESLVNPGRPISEAAFQVNKITSQMLACAPETKTVMPQFLDFIQGSCLCSYNAAFDLGFLDNELRLLGRTTLEGVVVIDILEVARRLLPGLKRYALWFVAEKLELNILQTHRALSDVELTLKVFTKLKDLLSAKGILGFTNFSDLFSISPVLLDDVNNQKLAKIQQAMDLGVKLKIRYLSSSSAEVSEREVIPKEIKQENSRFYLVGYCCLRNEERTFRLNNMLSIEVDK
jgi:DNA polymerase III epsilon subunit